MRTIIILGSVLALIGLASTAEASDWHRDGGHHGTRMHRESHADHERHAYREHSRNHHEARRHGSRERHHESHERSERR